MLDKPVLTGDRIVLRPLRADDDTVMFSLLANEEVDRLTGTTGRFTLEQVEAHYARVETADDRADYAIVTLGLHRIELPAPHRTGSL